MSLDALIEGLKTQAGNTAPFGSTLKFVLDDAIVYIDGSGTENIVSREDKEAACTISTDSATFQKLKDGDLNPMMAVMSGKIKIKGDMGLAMKLQSLL